MNSINLISEVYTAVWEKEYRQELLYASDGDEALSVLFAYLNRLGKFVKIFRWTKSELSSLIHVLG